MMPWSRLLADAIVIIHAAFVAYVVLGMGAILVGMVLRWEWVRNVWFRVTHLAAIGVVVLETVGDVACPLTTWEKTLRRLAGGAEVSGMGFIEYWVHRAIFIDLPPWVFVTAYTL